MPEYSTKSPGFTMLAGPSAVEVRVVAPDGEIMRVPRFVLVTEGITHAVEREDATGKMFDVFRNQKGCIVRLIDRA